MLAAFPTSRRNSGRGPRSAVAGCSCVAVLALAVSGCGGSFGSPKEQVREAWNQLKDAYGSEDAGELCALFSKEAETQFIKEASAVGPASSCEEAAETLFQATHAQLATRISTATIESIEIHSTHATVEDTTGPPPTKFIEVGGHWKIAPE